MNTDEIIEKAQREFGRLSNVPVNSVMGLSRNDEGWLVKLEGIERRGIPDTSDVLGLYEVQLDNGGNLLGFQRTRLRRRGDTEGE